MKIAPVLLLIILAIVTLGCTGTSTSDEKDQLQQLQIKLDEKTQALEEATAKLIELQENEKYLKSLKDNAINEKAELQELFNQLFTDATNCYWANDCLYYPEACVNHFKDVYLGWTAEDLHIKNSDDYEMMIRDWEDYYTHDTSIE